MTKIDMNASRRGLLAGVLGTGGLAMAMPAAAAETVTPPSDPTSDFFLMIPGIPGEVTSNGFEDAIRVVLWSFGFAVEDDGRRRRRRPTVQPLMLAAPFSTASPLLQLACLRGRVLPSAQLFARRPGNDGSEYTYLEIELRNVLVTSYEVATGDQDGYPLDVLETAFEEIKVTYTSPDGSTTEVEYDVGRGR